MDEDSCKRFQAGQKTDSCRLDRGRPKSFGKFKKLTKQLGVKDRPRGIGKFSIFIKQLGAQNRPRGIEKFSIFIKQLGAIDRLSGQSFSA